MNSGIVIDKKDVLYYLGYSDQKLSFELEKNLERAIELCKQLARPKHVLKEFLLNVDFSLAGTDYVLEGDSIKKHLSGCGKVCLIAATLGLDIDIKSQALFVSDPAFALMLDGAASACIESYLDSITKTLAPNALRFSGGYGDFPLNSNKKIAALLSAEKHIGLKVSEQFLLSPKKSVIAVFGLGGKKNPPCDGKCKICKLEKCAYL